MKVMLEIEYPNDKILKADTLPIRIVDLNYGIYFDGKAKIVHAIPIEWIWKWYDEETHRLGDGWTHIEHPYSMKRMIEDWEKENGRD